MQLRFRDLIGLLWPILNCFTVNKLITGELLRRYLAGNCTPAERQCVEEWYASYENGPLLYNDEKCPEAIALKEKTKSTIREIIAAQTIDVPAIRKRGFTYMHAAAAILVLLMAGIYGALVHRSQSTPVATHNKPQPDAAINITPGSNKAMLTLADGSTIVLDNAANGTLTQQGNAQVMKPGNGQLAYAINNNQASAAMTYNVLATPKGGQYQLQLPDGSKVWLNAASSIRYPTAFTGKERSVEIKGEAYFEVTKNATKPFVVKVNDLQVQVLGTHFNINAYSDEDLVKTTLLEGSVKVKSEILKPGDQAQVMHNSGTGNLRVIHGADIAATMAWKDGLFQFDNVTIETVMRQVARWYDVEVVYERDVSQDRFQGKIYRQTAISQLLSILELSGAHFKIEGKKIIVQ